MGNLPRIVRRLADVRRTTGRWRAAGRSVALVPTMGALHAGHLSLVKLALKKADRVVVSIFVNPTQFGPGEDLARYPRDEAGDITKLRGAGTHLVWAPEASEMYPDGFATRISPAGAAEGLEGEFRPHHFAGVATVCLKLFTATAPDIAVFGEKDYQQLCVIRRLVRDLALPVRIVAAPTMREKDGLALSSRNTYLSPEERTVAPALHRVLSSLANEMRKGSDPSRLTPQAIAAKCHDARRDLERAGFTRVDYVEVRDAEALGPFDPNSGRPARVLAAAWLGRTRLIDNVPI